MPLTTLTPLLLGLLSGGVLGMTGAGGAIIAVPVLVFGMDLPMIDAAPIALLATAIGAATGALLGFREGILRYKAAAVMSLCGVLLSPVGLWIAGQLPNRPLQVIFAAVLFHVAITMYLRAHYRPDSTINHTRGTPCLLDQTRGKLIWTLPCFRAMVSAGALAGFLSGLLGVGGGFVIVPALHRVTNLPMRTIMTTSLGVIAIVSVGSIAGASIEGTMQWEIGLPFATGAFLGMLFGRSLSGKLNHALLQRVFSGFAFLVACAMLAKAFL